MGRQSPRAAAAQDVEDPVDDFAPLIADIGGIFSESRDQGLQDLPLCICQVRWVGFPAWHHFPPPLSFFSLLLLSFIGLMTPPLHLLRPDTFNCAMRDFGLIVPR